MGQYGIFDAFQAAAGATQTVLGELDRQNRLKAEIELQSAKTQAAEQFNQYLIDLQYRNDFENFRTDWENKSKEIYNNVTKGLSSPFARRLYDMQYKDLHSTQSIKIAGYQRAKLAEFNTVNTFNNITDIIESASYSETTDETGRTISVTEQKAADAQKALLTLYQYEGRSYENLNSDLQKVGKQLLLHTMEEKAFTALDNGEDIEAVLDGIRADTSQLTLLNNQTVYSKELKKQVQESATDYYTTKIHYKQERNQNSITQRYNDLLKKSVLESYGAAVPFAKQLLNDINSAIAKDKTALSRPFSESKTKELVDFLSEQDKYLKGGGVSAFGFLAKLDVNDLAEVIIEQLKNGYAVLNKDGTPSGETKYFSAIDIVDHYNKNMIPEMAQALGVSETEMRYKFAGLKDAVSAKLFDDKHCPQDIKIFLKNNEQDIENIARARMGKKADTAEGKIAISTLQSGFYLDLTTKLLKSNFVDKESGMWKLEAVKQARDEYMRQHLLNEFSAVKEEAKTEATAPVQRHLIGEDRKQAIEAGALLDTLGKFETQDVHGRPIETEQMRKYKEQLINYTWNDIAARDGITLNEAQAKYSLVVDAKNGVVHLTENAGSGRIDGVVVEDEEGNRPITFMRVREEGDKSYYEALESGRTVADKRKKEEKNTEKFQNDMADFGDRWNLNSGAQKPASDAFKAYVETIPPEQQTLFSTIKKSVQKNARKTGADTAQMEQRTKAEYERVKNTIAEFEKTMEVRIPEHLKDGTKGDVLSCYTSLTAPYDKVTFIDAYEKERRETERGSFSLLHILNNFITLAKERSIYNGSGTHIGIVSKVAQLERRAAKEKQ